MVYIHGFFYMVHEGLCLGGNVVWALYGVSVVVYHV
jgi:hypothetical protein